MDQIEPERLQALIYRPPAAMDSRVSIPQEWAALIVDSVDAATGHLGTANFDVVVTVGPEPGRDSLEVLEVAKQVRPEAVRILASQSSGDSVSVAAVAHHHLLSPVDSRTLAGTCEQAQRTKARLAVVRERVVSKGRYLPSFPQVYLQVTEALQSGRGDLDRIADIVRCDPVLIGRVLQLVNSPVYGLRNPVHELRQALGLIGTQTLLALVLATKVFNDFEAGAAGLSVTRMWSHCMAVGSWSRRIAESAGRDRDAANAAFVAGMLHDCGRLLLASTQPQRHAELLASLGAGDVDLIEGERAFLGASHQEVGGVLLESWAFPLHMVEAVAHHHTPSESSDRSFSALTAVHLAEHFQSLVAGDGVEIVVPLDWDYLGEVGVSNDDIAAWKLACEITEDVQAQD
jgi:HD-like signal output (HDOD) protein